LEPRASHDERPHPRRERAARPQYDERLPEHDTDAKLTLYLRRASRLRNPAPKRGTIVDGDVLDRARLEAAMKGQDVVYANLAGDMKRQAESIVAAMRATGVRGLAARSTGTVPPTTAMTHIAITEGVDGNLVAWLEKVSDEQYAGIRSQASQ